MWIKSKNRMLHISQINEIKVEGNKIKLRIKDGSEWAVAYKTATQADMAFIGFEITIDIGKSVYAIDPDNFPS